MPAHVNRCQWRLGALLVLVCHAALSACSPSPGDDPEALVRAYVDALIVANEEIEPGPVEPYVTENQMQEVLRLLHHLTFRGEVMRSVVEEFVVQEVNQREDDAIVRTAERWTFWLEEEKTGRTATPEQVIDYRNTYLLVRVDGQWRIDAVHSERE